MLLSIIKGSMGCFSVGTNIGYSMMALLNVAPTSLRFIVMYVCQQNWGVINIGKSAAHIDYNSIVKLSYKMV